jgi:hypothetical protein
LADEAETLLAQLQGDRRRRVRGSDGPRKIGVGKKRKKKSKVGPDGFLLSSGSEDEAGGEREMGPMTKSEVKRAFGSGWLGDDIGLGSLAETWPDVPAGVLSKVLTVCLEKIMEWDEETNGGIFTNLPSESEMPEYYQEIQRPIAFSDMLARVGDYKSAAAFQTDVRLLVSNCIQFNKGDEEINKAATNSSIKLIELFRSSCLMFGIFLTASGEAMEVLR